MRAVVQSAASHPLYERLFRTSSLDWRDFRGLEDLEHLPISQKSDYQELAPEDSVARGVALQSLVRIVTTGSTGNPLIIRRTWWEDRILGWMRYQALTRYGLGPRDRRVVLSAMASSSPAGLRDPGMPLWMRLGFFGYFSVDLRAGPKEVLRKLRELKPATLGGQISGLVQLSLELEAADLRGLNLKFLTGGISTVTADMRRKVELGFGKRLYVTYGASEFNLLAWECPETGLLHLNETGAIVEVRNGGAVAGDGEAGRVYATSLHSHAMPFLRYDLGDWAVMGPSPCPCGMQVRTLREVQGRVLEFFRLPGGRSVHPFVLSNPLLQFTGWLGEYRIIQEAEDRVGILFRAVRNAPVPPDAVEQIRLAVERAAGGGVRVEARLVERFEDGGQAKVRVFQPLATS